VAEGRLINASFALGSDPGGVSVHRWTSGGRERCAIALSSSLDLHVNNASPQVLRALATAAAELSDWREQQIAHETATG
jgi:hypothetical protein